MVFSKIHKIAEIEVPEGVSEDEVEIIGGACDARGQWDERVEAVVLHAANLVEPKDKGDEGKTKEPTKTEGTVIEPPRNEPKGRGRGKAHDKAAPTPTPATPADQPDEPNAETAADTPAEKS
jgi:hypothetical protein